jgi:hypothetical protein
MKKRAGTEDEALNEIKNSVSQARWADRSEFHQALGSTHFLTIDRYRRHDHGGGEDGDDWLPDHEVEADFAKGKKEHGRQLETVNELLKKHGFKPNATFDLGEKGHFAIVFDFVKDKATKVKPKKSSVLRNIQALERIVNATEEMTCEDFFDSYMDNHDWSTMADEMHWEDNFSSERCFKKMKELAKHHHVKLTNEDDFDYDEFFYQTYKDTEKGLS